MLLAVCGTVALTLRPTFAGQDAPGAPAGADAAQQGAQVFQSNGCGFCHENGGKTAAKGPQLMGTARDDAFIKFRIQHGKEAKMPAFGGSLTDTQIADVIAYIRSLKD